MDPRFVLETTSFRATSGNRVMRVIDLGADGMCASWIDKPTAEDIMELERWILTKLPKGAWVTTDIAGQGDAGIQKARENYAAWKKTGKLRWKLR